MNGPDSAQATRRRNYAILALMAMFVALTIAAYWIGLSGPFLFDDPPNLGGVQQWLKGDIPLKTLLLANGNLVNSRSLAMASFALNAHWMGYDPFGFKLFNLIVHLACGLVAFKLWSAVLRRDAGLSTRASLAAVLVVGVWLLHPFNVSTVLYAVQRMTQVAALCCLLGLWLYVWIRTRQEQGQPPKLGWLALFLGVPALTILGILGKQNAAVLPALCLVLELAYFRTPRTWPRPLLAFYILGLALPALLAGIGLALRPEWLLRGYEEYAFTPMQRLLSEARVLCDYLRMLLVPHSPSMGVYTDDYAASVGLFSPPTTALAVAFLLGASVAAWRLRTRCPSIFAGWFFFLVGHAVEGTILPIELYYEHRNYLPAFGIFVAAGGIVSALARWLSKQEIRPGRIGVVSAVALFGMLLLQTHGRARVWSDPVVLASSAALSHPDSTRAVASYIGLISTYGDYAQARQVADTTIHNTKSEQTRAHILLFRIWLDCQFGRKASSTDLASAVDALPRMIDLTTIQMLRFARVPFEQSTCKGISLEQMAAAHAAIVDRATAQSDDAWPKYFLRLKSARLYARANRWDLALDQARKANRPTTPTPAMTFLVMALISNGETAEARRTFEEARSRAKPGRQEDAAAVRQMARMVAEAERSAAQGASNRR